MEQRALLPVRFGTLVADDAAAAAAVAGRGEALAGALRRVRGAVELSVRAVAPGQPDEGSPGEHLQARAAHERTAAALHERLAARRARARAPRRPRAAAGGVPRRPRARSAASSSLVRGLQAEHAELSILCTGPWPPYSFAEPEDA